MPKLPNKLKALIQSALPYTASATHPLVTYLENLVVPASTPVVPTPPATPAPQVVYPTFSVPVKFLNLMNAASIGIQLNDFNPSFDLPDGVFALQSLVLPAPVGKKIVLTGIFGHPGPLQYSNQFYYQLQSFQTSDVWNLTLSAYPDPTNLDIEVARSNYDEFRSKLLYMNIVNETGSSTQFLRDYEVVLKFEIRPIEVVIN